MRTNLKVLRVKNGLSQQEMADRLGVSRITYSAYELGQRVGKKAFWDAVQAAFNVPSEEMWELMKIDD